MGNCKETQVVPPLNAIDEDEPEYPLASGDLCQVDLNYEELDQAILSMEEHENAAPISSSVLGKRKEPPAAAEFGVPLDLKRQRSLDSIYGINDNTPFIIAHCPKVQASMENLRLSQGVYFELARLITNRRLNYKDITKEKLVLLQGTNDAVVPNILQLLKQEKHNSDSEETSTSPLDIGKIISDEKAATYPWRELDREEAALARGPYEGLGNNDKEPEWYGGKVEFKGRLKIVSDNAHSSNKHFEIILDSCALGRSCRFTRRFGSWSFIRIKIPLDLFHGKHNNLDEFFKKSFIIWGKVFRACYAKADNIFLFWTNEYYPFGCRLTIPGRLSLRDFIQWHNPIENNSKQLMTKWSARMALGFSNSIPGPRILRGNIVESADITSESGSDMTDGCGQASKSVHRALLDLLPLSSMPSAFQFRLAGCKGMLMFSEEPDSQIQDTEHRAWVRPSQIKIRYPQNIDLDPAMLTFDILRVSRLTSPSRIAAEMIINLAENGVPHAEFVKLLHDDIQEMFDGLTSWDVPNAMLNLWTNVERIGHVLPSRRAREAPGEARVRGYTNVSPEDVELEDNNDEDDLEEGENASQPKSVAWWGDPVSGCPSSLEETVMALLDSGFHPRDCAILREKLKIVIGNRIDLKTRDLKLQLKQSCAAFAVPDPYSVLGPNEIQIKSSRRNLVGQDGLLTDIILGDVVVGRNPCKVPTDMRKVKAVEHPKLSNFVDVIVFSVQGYRRLIDFLAGGDYDGDVVLAIWAAFILFFRNADEKFSLDPAGIDYAFTRDAETGQHFLDRTKDMTEGAKIHAMQKYLLGALVDPSLVGKYSIMHNNAIYNLGYAHPRTHKIGAKCVRVLDSSKTGFRIKPETLAADLQQYFHPQGPKWQALAKEKKKKTIKPIYDERLNGTYLQRDKSSDYVKGQFIMDRLHKAAQAEKERFLIKVDELFAPLPNIPDPALLAPWKAALEWSERHSVDKDAIKSKKMALSKIAVHVRSMYQRNKAVFIGRGQNMAAANGNAFTSLAIETRQDELRALSKSFWAEPILEDVPEIPDQATLDRWRASYAYTYDADMCLKDGVQGWSRFPWNVALRELCAIKAASLGPYKVVSNNFYERFKLVNAL